MLNETTPEKEFIVAIKIKESEYPRLQRLISGEIILHATAKKSNVEAVRGSIDPDIEVEKLTDCIYYDSETKKCCGDPGERLEVMEGES